MKNLYMKNIYSYRRILFWGISFYLTISLFKLSSNERIIISLGHNCMVASMLNKFNLRKEAYPFDWIVSSYDGLYRSFDSDFKDYFLKENLIKSEPIYSEILNNYLTHVIDLKYEFYYKHDFPINNLAENNDNLSSGIIVENYYDYYLGVYEKYQKRILRLRNILNSKKVLFR